MIMELDLFSSQPVTSLALHPATGLLAVGQQGDDGTNPNLTLWHPPYRARPIRVAEVADESVTAMCFSKNGTLYYFIRAAGLCALALDSQEVQALDWDVSEVRRLRFGSDGTRLLVCGRRTELREVATGRTLWHLSGYDGWGLARRPPDVEHCWPETPPAGYSLQPALADLLDDGSIAVTGHNHPSITVFDPLPLETSRKIPCGPLQSWDLLTVEDDNFLAVAGRIPRGLWLWNLVSGERRVPEIFDGSHEGIVALTMHRNSECLLVGTSTGYVSAYELETGRLVNSEQRHAGSVQAILVDGNGAVISGGDDGRVVFSRVE